jgi:hypothetical protein
LLTRTDAGRRPIRLLGVSVHNLQGDDGPLGPSDQLPFADEGRAPDSE